MNKLFNGNTFKKQHNNINTTPNSGCRSDLRALVNHEIVEEMVGKVVSSNPSKWCVLVLDKRATRVLSSVVRMGDLIDKGVSIVEKLDLKRQPFPEFPVIYFIEPSERSIQHVIRDFSPSSSSSGGQCMYQSVHLFFLSRITPSITEKIKSAPLALRRNIKTLQQINIDFLPLEKFAFSLDMPDSFRQLNSISHRNNERLVLQEIALKLVTVCATLKEYPFVRFHKQQPTMGLLADEFQKQMDLYCTENKQFCYTKEKRATLLLLDRSGDCLTPLLHQFSYQSVVYDLLDVQNDQEIVYDSENNQKHVLLNENDSLWVDLRHDHIAAVSEKLNEKLIKFSKKTQGSKSKACDVKDLSNIVRELPQYQEVLAKIKQHVFLCGKLMDCFNKFNLMQICSLEQCMVTGVDEDGNKRNTAWFTKELSQLIQSDSIRDEDKVRMLSILLITQENMKDTDRKKLLDDAKLSRPYEDALLNIRKLGATNLKRLASYAKNCEESKIKNTVGDGKKTKLSMKFFKFSSSTTLNSTPNSSPSRNQEFASTRFEPPLKLIFEQIHENNLDSELFPFVKAPPPDYEIKHTNKNTPSSMRKRKDNKTVEQGDCGRIIAFFVGGASFSEIRSIYELREQKNISAILGATNFLTPTVLLNTIARLEDTNTISSEGNSSEKISIDDNVALEEIKLSPIKKKKKKIFSK